MPNLAQLNPTTLGKALQLEQACRASGFPIVITSAYRSNAEQQSAYAKAQLVGGVAAAPGTSCHEVGAAIDISIAGMERNKAWPRIMDLAAALGLLPLSNLSLRRRDPGHLTDVETCAKAHLKQSVAPPPSGVRSPTIQPSYPQIAVQGTGRRGGCR